MNLLKILFYLFLSLQSILAQDKLENLASTIATPFYNAYDTNVIEILEQYMNNNKYVEAIKVYDNLINKPSIILYKKDGNFIFELGKDFPKSLQLPNRLDSVRIFKNEKRIGVITIFYKQELGEDSLSIEENNYLNKKKIIRMCIDPNWLPFQKIENGKHIGIVAEFMKIFSQNLNIPIKLIKTKSWQESLDFAKNRKCDIISIASKTPQRKKYMDFTSSYIDSSIVLSTRIGVPFLENIEQVINKKIGVVKGYSFYEELKNRYPSINLIEINSIQDGLDKVESGDIFGYLDNSIVLNYHIQRNHIGTLAISGKFEDHYNLSVATRNDEPLLLSIFQKAINSITQNEKDQIYKKWISVKIEKIKVVNYFLVYSIVIVTILLLLFGFWNRKITRINKKLELAQKEIVKLAHIDKLTGLYNRARLDELFEQEIQRCKRFNHQMIISILDIDHFKKVNDTYGHQVGDKILIEIAKLLQENTRKTDYVGRWGGEEFVIIYPEINKSQGLILIENLRIKIASHNFTEVGYKTASFGVTEFFEDDTMGSIIKRADKALYEAKKSGRNKVIYN